MKKKKILKIFMITTLASSMFLINVTNNVKAALSIRISGVPSVITPGATFNVTVSIPNALGGTVTLSGNNCIILGTNPQMVDGSATFTVKAGGNGNATITASCSDATVDGDLENVYTAYGSTSFRISSGNTGSNTGGNSNNSENTGSNNQSSNLGGEGNTNSTDQTNKSDIDLTLASLKVSEGKLSPDFASDKYEYTLSLKSDVTKLKVEAKAKDAKATIEGSKEYDVKAGKNEIKVIVSDGKGNSKTYTIIATVEEKIINSLTLGKDKIGILNDLSSADILEGFEDYKVKINKTEYNAKRSNLMDITLVYGLDSEGNKNYYIFDEKSKKITSIYKPIALLGNQYALITVPEDMKKMTGYKYTDIEIDGQKFKGWTFKDKEFKNYSLIYLMNDKGEKHLYQYESSMNRLQLFSGAAPITQEKYEEELAKVKQQTLILMIVAGVSTLIAVVGIGSLIVFKKKMK